MIPKAGQAANVAGSLKQQGANKFRTKRYTITIKQGEVKIFDRKNQTWVKVHGDPHVVTSDGDHGQFHEDNLTFELEDGTKVTITPTEKDAAGNAYIESVSIMNGEKAVVITDVHSGPQFGTIGRNAGMVDAAFDDGTVLVAGNEVDDLTFEATGQELSGIDPTRPFNEWLLDGIGGQSRLDFERALFDGSGRLRQGLDGPIGELIDGPLRQLEGNYRRLQEKMSDEIAETGEVSPETMFELQKAQQNRQMLISMITNMLKSEHDSRMAIISNLRA